MKRMIALFYLLFPLFCLAQQDSLLSGVYNWKEPKGKNVNGASVVLFEGQAHAMEWLQVSANVLAASIEERKNATTVPANEEQMIIIKSGTMSIVIGDSSYPIGTGSVVSLMPGENYLLSNAACSYYTIKYRSSLPADAARGKAAGSSKVINWDTVAFKAHDKGGRRDFIDRPTALSRRVEVHASTLKPGLKSHNPHTHISPEMVLVTEGQTEMQIGNQFYPGKVGSIYFLASNNLHAIQNKGSGNCTYFAIQLE